MNNGQSENKENSGASPQPGAPSERRRAMIVEDEGMTALYLRRVLRSSGYEVVGAAENGQQAIELARAVEPDFILMDINMPVLNGIEATKQIMAERSLPIIMLTAYSETEFVENAKEAGACGYLIKPLVKAQMLPAIAEAFRCYDDYLKTGVASFYLGKDLGP